MIDSQRKYKTQVHETIEYTFRVKLCIDAMD
jgi:hypothetical protein